MNSGQGRWAGGAVAAAGVVHAAPALCARSATVRRALGVAVRTSAAKAVTLTFDDGPHPAGTPAVLEILREREVHATFFLAAEQVERRPALAAEIAAAGHEIAVHCYRHRNLLRLTPAQVADDLARAIDVTARATGHDLRWYRPPYGVLSAAGLVAARRAGLQTVLWSRWGRDWRRGATPQQIARDVAGEVVAGDVLLLHDADFYSARDSWMRTVAALPAVLDRVAAAGLAFTALPAPRCAAKQAAGNEDGERSASR